MNTSDFQLQFFIIGFLGISLGIISVFFSIKKKKIDLFSPPILALIILWFQFYIPAFTLPYSEVWFYPHNWNLNEIIFYPILLTSLAWIFFLFGYSLKGGKKIALSLPKPLKSKLFSLVGIAFLIIGLFFTFLVVIQSGGIGNIAKSNSVTKGTGIFVILSQVIIPGILICWVKKSTRILAISLGLIYLFFNLVSQSRGAGIMVLVFIFISSYYFWKFNNKITLIFMGSGLFFISFASMLATRFKFNFSINYVLLYVEKYIENISKFLLFNMNRDISKLHQLSIIIDYFPDKIDLYWMQTFLMGSLGPFAKYIFPDYIHWPKLVTAVIFRANPETIDWGFGASSMGELYVNLGVLGVIMGWFLFGVLGRILYEWFILNAEGKIRSIIIPLYIMFLKIYMGLIIEGSPHIFYLWLLVIPLLSLKWIKKKKTIISLNY